MLLVQLGILSVWGRTGGSAPVRLRHLAGHQPDRPRLTPPVPPYKPAAPEWMTLATFIRYASDYEGVVQVLAWDGSPAFAWYASDLQTFTGFDGPIEGTVLAVLPVPYAEAGDAGTWL